MSDWSKLCFEAIKQPTSSLRNQLYGSGISLVRSACRVCCAFVPTAFEQLVAFGICALSQGLAFFRWTGLTQADKNSVWKYYILFMTFAFVSSIAGALCFGMRMHKLSIFYEYSALLPTLRDPGTKEEEETQRLNAESRLYTTVEYIFQPFEMAFTALALLLVLHRVKDFAFGTQSLRSPEQTRKKNIVVRFTVFAISGLILLSFCSCFVASAYFLQGSNLNTDSQRAYANNNVAEGDALSLKAVKIQSLGDFVVGISRWADVTILLLMVVAFIVMAVFSSKAIGSALQTLFIADQQMEEIHLAARGAVIRDAALNQNRKLIAAASLEGQQLRRKILSTFIFTFFALLLRAIVTLIYALASSGQDNSSGCDPSYCARCKNVYSNIQGWLLYTPSFQMAAVLISSPFAMTVALWGMSGVRALDDLTSHNIQLQSVATDKSSLIVN
jgi:hypothetical protein